MYLLLLTASVLALFVLIQQLKQENHVLKLRISSWSSGSPRRREGGLPRTKFQRKFGRGPSSITSTNLDINQCCVSSRKTFREFRAKFAKTSDLVGSLLKAYHEKFEFTTRHFAEIKKDLKILRNRIVKVKSTNEKDDKTEKQLSSKDENQTYCENGKLLLLFCLFTWLFFQQYRSSYAKIRARLHDRNSSHEAMAQ